MGYSTAMSRHVTLASNEAFGRGDLEQAAAFFAKDFVLKRMYDLARPVLGAEAMVDEMSNDGALTVTDLLVISQTSEDERSVIELELHCTYRGASAGLGGWPVTLRMCAVTIVRDHRMVEERVYCEDPGVQIARQLASPEGGGKKVPA